MRMIILSFLLFQLNWLVSQSLTFGLVGGVVLNHHYNEQTIDGLLLDYDDTEFNTALGGLVEYRMGLTAIEMNVIYYARDISYTLWENFDNTGTTISRSNGHGGTLEMNSFYFPLRISKITKNKQGNPINKIYGGLGMGFTFSKNKKQDYQFEPDLQSAIDKSFERITPYLNLGYELFLGKVGLQFDVNIALTGANGDILVDSGRVNTDGKSFNLSLMAVYRFYKNKKGADIWY